MRILITLLVVCLGFNSLGAEEAATPTATPARSERLRTHELKIKETIEQRKRERAEREALEAATGATSETLTVRFPRLAGASKPDPDSPKVTLIMSSGKPAQAAAMLAAQTKGIVAFSGAAADGQVTCIAQDLPIEQLLEQLALSNDWYWWRTEGGGYAIADREYYETNAYQNQMVTRDYKLEHVTPEKFKKAVGELGISGLRFMTVDESGTRLLIREMPAVQDRIAEAKKLIDAAP